VNVPNKYTPDCHLWFVVNSIKNHHINPALHLRVDPTDGRQTFVPEGGNEGADKELPCVNVAQDLDPSPEGPKANLAIGGKPRIINPAF
jgi:hypothetical protein